MNVSTNVFKALNDLKIYYPTYLEVMEAIDNSYQNAGSKSRIIMVTGESGSGKTTILHDSINKVDVTRDTILTTNVFIPGNVLYMTEYFLDKLSIVYYEDSSEHKMNLLIKAINQKNIKLIYLDDFQHFKRYPNNKNVKKYKEWIERIFSETDVNFVLFGLPSSETLLKNINVDKQTIHYYTINPFKYGTSEERNFFKFILNELEEQLPLSGKLYLSNFSDEIFASTSGNMDDLITLITDATFIAIEEGSKKIHRSHLCLAYKNNAFFSQLENPFEY